MTMPHPIDELAALREFLDRLESGQTRMVKSGVDVTKTEAAVVRREIAHLEKVIERLKSGKASP